MLSPKQLALLRVAKLQLGLDEDTYRAVLRNHGGVASATQLDNAAFDRVMAYLKAQGFTPRLNRRRGFGGERPGMASAGQVAKIKAMWRDYAGRDDPAALDKWLEGKFHVTTLRFATTTIAQKAINGLTKMVARKRPAEESPPAPAA